ncbi:MAG: metallophosphoesterase family protein [Verrucomicrobiota bacterium]|nr:metallophosphoesterase family protein [Verrucomicrobiota bacterium]
MRQFKLSTQTVATLFVILILPHLCQSHNGPHPSVHDTVAGILNRFKSTLSTDEIVTIDLAKARSLLTEKEKHILSHEHISFHVNIPVKVFIIRDASMGDKPFWLKEREFKPLGLKFKIQNRDVDFWVKDFETGRVSLGINSLSGNDHHYGVALMPLKPNPKLEVTKMYPGQLRTAAMKEGVKPFVDKNETLPALPAVLSGLTILQTVYENRNDAKLIGIYRKTSYPSGPKPDQIVLTWANDPTTSQTIQWRTDETVNKSQLQWIKKNDYNRFQPGTPKTIDAVTSEMLNTNYVNDPKIHRHTVNLTGLEPNTTYLYSVGLNSANSWSELSEFKTAPNKTEPFSFVYMGDAQNGLDGWRSMITGAFRKRPNAAFYIMAGDLVDRGNEIDDWDNMLHQARDIYDRRPLIPAIGNHEIQGGHPTTYLKLFDLPKNGPEKIEPERCYTFKYSNAEFFILDTTLAPKLQTEWLEKVLSTSTATWKFAVYHHPAYSSEPARDNKKVRNLWTPIFDKYHLDMALQGHDHAYLRTYPMKGQKRVATAKEGTYYIVSVSGTKFYEQDPRDYTEVGFTNTPTFQILDILIDGNKLIYKAYDAEDKIRDEIVIEK